VAPPWCWCAAEEPGPTARPCPVMPMWMCLDEVPTPPPEDSVWPGVPLAGGMQLPEAQISSPWQGLPGSEHGTWVQSIDRHTPVPDGQSVLLVQVWVEGSHFMVVVLQVSIA
jgi:hypothetical protein